MLKNFNPTRYAVIEQKNKREIVMLIGTGCKWRRCKFCDYHLDHEINKNICYQTNKAILAKVTGKYGKLEVINSGSFSELDEKTMQYIEDIAKTKKIYEIHFECHYLFRKQIAPLRTRFLKKGIVLKLKCGVETFDSTFRTHILDKGMGDATPLQISHYFDEVCLLFGLSGQTVDTMRLDIKLGIEHFERVCINIMQANSCSLKPDQNIINIFKTYIYTEIKNDQRIDILLENTAFGVGGINP